METIKKGSRGEAVKKLQELLLMSNVDGIFGPATEAAVVEFQATNGLSPDAIVGPKTWAALLAEPATKELLKPSIVYNPISVHITPKARRTIKYLAIHFTAGSSSAKGKARATRKVFLDRQASADFIVDDAEIVQINPDLRNYYCWAVGDKKSKEYGGATLPDACNSNTISIEICSNIKKGYDVRVDNHEGWYYSEASLDNAIRLSKYLMKEYNIPIGRVVRHYDISGKKCPGIYGYNDGPMYDSATGKKNGKKNNSAKWLEFKKRLE